jgi:hypothetical protein
VGEEAAPGLHCHSVRGAVAIGKGSRQEPQVDRDLKGFAQVRAWFGHGPDMILAWFECGLDMILAWIGSVWARIGVCPGEKSTADLEG